LLVVTVVDLSSLSRVPVGCRFCLFYIAWIPLLFRSASHAVAVVLPIFVPDYVPFVDSAVATVTLQFRSFFIRGSRSALAGFRTVVAVHTFFAVMFRVSRLLLLRLRTVCSLGYGTFCVTFAYGLPALVYVTLFFVHRGVTVCSLLRFLWCLLG